MNEGHADSFGIERILSPKLVTDAGLDFTISLTVVRSTVFTTHTPVLAGIDRFCSGAALRHRPARRWPVSAAVSCRPTARRVWGRRDDPPPNMAHMGLLGQRRSLLHGRASRAMFNELGGIRPR